MSLSDDDVPPSSLQKNAAKPGQKTNRSIAPQSSSALTKREHEVLVWISEGKRDAEIAILLNVSVRTINKHVQSILYKLRAETRTAAARYALETGLSVEARTKKPEDKN
jgi:DNA-binding CsgD family transcriptional regulator